MHESAPSTNISLFSYLEFRDYLSDWFDAKKKENRRYSHRLFARQIGQKSPSFLSDVIKGRRRLTVETAMAVAQALGLNKTERRYFQLLVTLQQSDEDETKDKIMREVLALRKRFGAITSLEGEAFEILSQWEYTAVYELLKRPDFRLDPVWIGKAIQPPISSRKARSGGGDIVRRRLTRQRRTRTTTDANCRVVHTPYCRGTCSTSLSSKHAPIGARVHAAISECTSPFNRGNHCHSV